MRESYLHLLVTTQKDSKLILRETPIRFNRDGHSSPNFGFHFRPSRYILILYLCISYSHFIIFICIVLSISPTVIFFICFKHNAFNKLLAGKRVKLYLRSLSYCLYIFMRLKKYALVESLLISIIII